MNIVLAFCEIVVKLSGLMTSLYLSLITINLVGSRKSELLLRQVLGFATLFAISLLVYLVI